MALKFTRSRDAGISVLKDVAGCSLPGLFVRHNSDCLFRLILNVIETERRFIEELVLKAEQLPADLVVVAAVFGIGEHSQYRHRASKLKELALFNFLEEFRLLLGVQIGAYRQQPSKAAYLFSDKEDP